MNTNELREYWKYEEANARINGWDFSYIEDRYSEGTLPWEYTDIINKYRKETDRLLDIDTGGGEFLLSLRHPYALTSATEGYPPNVRLCRERLGTLGINFREMSSYSEMPFPDSSFDIVINRHGSYVPEELFRILCPGGIFVTQQVGENNDRELVEMLLPGVPRPFPGHNLSANEKALQGAGFEITESSEVYVPIDFYDTGALVWFARIIEWEFPGFSVEKCFDELLRAEQHIRENGKVSGRVHRFYIAARKP